MQQDLSDEDVALMCDIGGAGAEFPSSKRARIAGLIERGLVEPDPEPGYAFRLTDQGQKLLADRGVGLNEA